jgi:hypothetical protein
MSRLPYSLQYNMPQVKVNFGFTYHYLGGVGVA